MHKIMPCEQKCKTLQTQLQEMQKYLLSLQHQLKQENLENDDLQKQLAAYEECIVEDMTEKQETEPASQITDDIVGSKETVIQATLPIIQATEFTISKLSPLKLQEKKSSASPVRSPAKK